MGLGYAFRTRRGIAEGLTRRRLEFHGRSAEPTPEGIQSTLQALFKEAPELTALIVHNEGVLDLLVHGLDRLGKRVPGDVSIVAIARDAIAQQVVPPLTCVAVPANEMGRQAIELLSSWDGSPARRLLEPMVLQGKSDSPSPGEKGRTGRGRRQHKDIGTKRVLAPIV